MKILVPVKRVVDYNVKVRVKADGSGVDFNFFACGDRGCGASGFHGV